MITTSNNTWTKPSFIQPAYSINGVSVSSDKTGETSHRYIFDVYVNNTKVGRLKSLPSFNTTSSVEISDIVKNYVENQYIHSEPKSTPNDDDNTTKNLYPIIKSYGILPRIKVLAGEEYKVNGVLTVFNGLDVAGEPSVLVSQWYSTYQAMDSNSQQVLVAKGNQTNTQFQANHLDVLEFLNEAIDNTLNWGGGVMRSSSQPTDIYKNYNVKELSNRPLDREKQIDIPSSIGYYEGNQIIYFDRIDDEYSFDRKLSTYGRRYDMDPLNNNPQYTGNYNTYRQRLQTIGYEYFDPSGLEVGEVRFQPKSALFGLPITDDFGYNSAEPYPSQDYGEKVSDFHQVNIETGMEYTKFDKYKSTDFINLNSQMDWGDFRGVNDITYFVDSVGTDISLVERPSVKHIEGQKICEYTPPSFVQYDTNIEPSEIAYSYEGQAGQDFEQTYRYSGTYNPSPIEFSFNTIYGVGGETEVVYQFYNVPDRIQIIDSNGITVLYDSGYVSNGGSHTFTPSNGKYSIIIYGDNTGTVWDLYVNERITSLDYWVWAPVYANTYYNMDWNVNDGTGSIRWEIDGLTNYNSGTVNGPATGNSDIFYNDVDKDGKMYFTRDSFDMVWNFDVNRFIPNPTAINLDDTAFGDITALQPSTTGFDSQTSTFSAFVNCEFFNNLGRRKNVYNFEDDDLYKIVSTEHMFIQDEFIIGIDNTLGELYGQRYDFNAAPCLRVWNNDDNRWATQDEIERLTGRSLEGLNFVGSNGRPAVEVLESKVVGQYEESVDKEVLLTFRINRGSGCPDITLLPGVFNGVLFTGAATNIVKVDRMRLVYGIDKPLRNANNYKVNIYDYDNNFNLLSPEIANGGKFTYNFDNMNSPFGYFNIQGVVNPGDDIPFYTYGVQGNYFGDFGENGAGEMNSSIEQSVGYGTPQNLPTGNTGTFVLFQPSISNYYKLDQATMGLSYLLQKELSHRLDAYSLLTGQIQDDTGSGYVNIQTSMMVYVDDLPENVDLTWLSLQYPLASGGSVINSQEIYKAQDKGRWKRIHSTSRIQMGALDDPSTTFLYPNLSVNTNLITDNNVWEGNTIYVADYKVNFTFETNPIERDNDAHKDYKKSLRKINEEREPHYTLSGDMLRNEAYSLYWLNPYGSWDDYRFTGRSIKETIANKTTRGVGLDKTGALNKSYVYSKQSFGDNITYKVKANEVYELTSDYLNQEEREWLEEMFISPKHFMFDEETKGYINVNILNKSYTTINKNNQKLYQIKVEVQISAERRTQEVLSNI